MSVHEDVFDGPAVSMPTAGDDTFGWAILSDDPDAVDVVTPGPVRHVEGYALFLVFAARRGVDPADLVESPLAALRFVQEHGAELSADDRLRAAATIFIGNTIASLRSDAVWRAVGPGRSAEVGAGRMSFDLDAVLDAITSTPDASAGAEADSGAPSAHTLAATLTEWAAAEQSDARDAAEQLDREARLRAWPAPQPAPSGGPRYTRPEMAAADFLADDGQRIPYGERWGMGSPDPESYSRVSHPERFAGLHSVASALIDYLERAFAVTVRRELPVPGAPGGGFDPPLLHPQGTVTEVVRVIPESPDAAPLSFAFTEFPGVFVEAGVLHTFPYPICGCDACDETAESQAGELEELVLGVVGGSFAEELSGGAGSGSASGSEAVYSLVIFDEAGVQTGWRSGSGGAAPTTVPAERLAAASATLAALPQGWQAWPRRG